MARRDGVNRWELMTSRKFPCEILVLSHFLSTIFSHWAPFSIGGFFFQTNRNRLVGATGAHFCQNSRSTNSPNFFFFLQKAECLGTCYSHLVKSFPCLIQLTIWHWTPDTTWCPRHSKYHWNLLNKVHWTWIFSVVLILCCGYHACQ